MLRMSATLLNEYVMVWYGKMLHRLFHTGLQVHSWVTMAGQFPMLSEEQNCHALVTVTGDDVTNSVKVIPRLETLVSLLP